MRLSAAPGSTSAPHWHFVVFAVHAFLACLITILQCIFYERDQQTVSTKCIILIIVLITFGFCSIVATVLNKISILAFVTSLSYINEESAT